MTERGEEFDALLDELSYAITSARTVGMHDPEKLRGASKKIRDLASHLDALAVTIVAQERNRDDEP